MNANIAQFVARLGVDDAAAVAKFFVQHNDSFYVKSMHSFALALRDAEALRTQWVKGKAITQADLRRFERQQQQEQEESLELQRQLLIAKRALERISDFYNLTIITNEVKEPKHTTREALESLNQRSSCKKE